MGGIKKTKRSRLDKNNPLRIKKKTDSTAPSSAPIKLDGATQENVLTLLCFGKRAQVQQLIERGVRSEIFDNEIYCRVADKALRHFKKRDRAPKQHIADLLEKEVRGESRTAEAYQHALRDLDYVRQNGFDAKFILDSLDEFLDQQRVKSGVVEMAKLSMAGDTAGAKDAARRIAEAAPTTTAPKGIFFEDYLTLDIPDLEAVVKAFGKGLFYRGATTILGAKPKAGKTRMLRGIALGVGAQGLRTLNFDPAAGDVLFLSLEDPNAVEKMHLQAFARTHRTAIPGHVAFHKTWPERGIPQLRTWLKAHPKVVLVVIDTIAKFLGISDAALRKINSYAADYQSVQELRKVAEDFNVALVLVYHGRKAAAEDPLDELNATTGLAAGVDDVLVLRRHDRDSATLVGRGRHVNEVELALTADERFGAWKAVEGPALTAEQTPERRQILRELRNAGGPLKLNKVADRIGKSTSLVCHLLKKLQAEGLVEQPKFGLYTLVDPSEPGLLNKEGQ